MAPLDLTNRTLIIPEKTDAERGAVADAWSALGGAVLRLGRFWDPPRLEPAVVSLYGNDTFCLVLAQQLDLVLHSPADVLVSMLEPRWLGRSVELRRLGTVVEGAFPCFVKPVVPKQFRAAVYNEAAALVREADGLPPDTGVLVSPVVRFLAEARVFVLRGAVLDLAIYEGEGSLAEAEAFAREFVAAVPLPEACVVDVGLLDGGGWVFVEANAAWGAGLNGCNAAKVLPAIAAATGVAGW